MRILTLSNLYPPDTMGGYEIACAQAVDGLRARGHQLAVLSASPRRPVPEAANVLRRFKLTEDRYWVAPSETVEDPLTLLRDVESRLICAHNVHALIAALGEFAPDVVYLCNPVGLGGLGLVACLEFLGVPWVWQLGDRVPFDVCALRGGVVRALAAEFSRGVRGNFVAVSRQLCDRIRADGVDLNGPVVVAPYWIAGRRGPARVAHVRDGVLRIMSSGRVHREKGIDVLLGAAAALRALGRENFAVDVYGELNDPSIPSMIRELGLTGHVRLCGPRPHDELLDLYAGYDMLAFPTQGREPFGIVPLEALSRGCVPVVTRISGVAEWLVHGIHCIKAARDAAAFAAVFAGVLDGRIALGPIAGRGEAAVWRDFHLDAVLPRIERALLDASRRPRTSAGSADDAYRLARLAEGLARSFVRETLCA